MSGKVKLSITTLCLSALALYHASTAWDTSLIRLIYTALGLGLLAVSFVTAVFKKKVWIVAAAVAVVALWGVFINRDFNKIEMARVIPEDAVVESIHVDGITADEEFFMCFWRPDEGHLRVNYLYNDSFDILGGGGVDFESLRTATFYSHWISEPTQHLASWFDRLDINFIRADGKRIDVSIYDNYDFNGGWRLYIDDYSGKNPYHNSNEKSYEVLTTADLSGMIPDSVAGLILREEKNIVIPTETGVNKAEKTAWTEDYSGNAELSTQMERTDEELLLNCSAHSQWVGDETPDKMTVTAEVYAIFEGAPEPALLDSITKEGEGVKTRFFNVPRRNLLEASPDGVEPVWVEVRLETVFTFGNKEQTVNNSVRYES